MRGSARRTGGRHQLHDVAPAAVRAHGQATANHLAHLPTARAATVSSSALFVSTAQLPHEYL